MIEDREGARPASTTPSPQHQHLLAQSGTPNIPKQRTSTGVSAAEQNADAWWWSCAWSAIESQATTNYTFTAYDLQETYGLADPDHPSRWGALFRAAATAGLIEKVGAVCSTRPARAGGLCWSWRGVQGKDGA